MTAQIVVHMHINIYNALDPVRLIIIELFLQIWRGQRGTRPW
jgi:hypothetical protein